VVLLFGFLFVQDAFVFKAKAYQALNFTLSALSCFQLFYDVGIGGVL
jgi:hypothetical protein